MTREQELARFNFRLFWGLHVELASLSPAVQAKHLAMAREQLQWMETQGWLKPEKTA